MLFHLAGTIQIVSTTGPVLLPFLQCRFNTKNFTNFEKFVDNEWKLDSEGFRSHLLLTS